MMLEISSLAQDKSKALFCRLARNYRKGEDNVENWTAGEWLKAISCVIIIIAAITRLATGKLRSYNLDSIRVLLTMIEEDRKEFFCAELDGNNIQDDLKAQLKTLKQNTADLYRMNKRDKNCIRVHKLIEQYHTQLVNLELEATKDLENKVLPKRTA